MTGIAGILCLDGAPLAAGTGGVLDAMGAQLAHRGLGERRALLAGPLGVVVPGAAGDAGNEGEVLVVLDGRITNLAALRAELGDVPADAPVTRILARLHALEGPGFVAKLEGSFALALWDARERRLLLARDPLGIRPLFHAKIAGNKLLFGSEVKALLAHPECPREVDWLASLVRIAALHRTRPRTSFFKGIDNLAPGSFVLADARGAVEVHSYHRFAPPPAAELEADTRSVADIIDGYRARLDEAVSAAAGGEHAGVLLSGGIDSVSIAALLARRGRVPTFSVLSRSTLGNGDARLAREAARALDLPNHQVIFDAADSPSPDAWRRLLWACESPQCAGQHFYKYHLHRAARARHPGLALMLNGEGSDELVGADFANTAEDREDGTYRDYIVELAEKQRPELLSHETSIVERWLGRSTFTPEFLAETSGKPALPHPWHRRIEYLLDVLSHEVLWRDDRLAAVNGMRSEVPFLDRRLVDFVLRIPPRAFPELFWQKHILREAMRPYVPDTQRLAKKVPFFGGVDVGYTWRLLHQTLVAEDRALIREAFEEGDAGRVLLPGLVDAMMEDAPRDPDHSETYALLVLTNLGLLQSMARKVAARPAPGGDIPELRAVDDWDEADMVQRLQRSDDVVDIDLPIAFAEGVVLVRPDTADAGRHPSFLVVDDEVRYVLEGDEIASWREVLRRIDGVRSLRSILAEVGVSEPDIRKHLEEALALHVVVLDTHPPRR